MADLFKEIVPAILETKKNPFTDGDYETYVPYVVNKALSTHLDCIMYANTMNLYPFLDDDIQFTYLLNTVRSYKRKFQPWFKKSEKETDLLLIKEYHNVSYEKAKGIQKLLSDQELEYIRNYLDKGGRKE